MQAVKDAVHEGRPKTKATAQTKIKAFWTCKDEISCFDGLLFKGNKVSVPNSASESTSKRAYRKQQDS